MKETLEQKKHRLASLQEARDHKSDEIEEMENAIATLEREITEIGLTDDITTYNDTYWKFSKCNDKFPLHVHIKNLLINHDTGNVRYKCDKFRSEGVEFRIDLTYSLYKNDFCSFAEQITREEYLETFNKTLLSIKEKIERETE